jgi:cyclopropane-fatty-acyl-phospholipid synthase
MEIVDKHLNNDGLFLLHTIGENFSSIEADPWIDKYIFPNGAVPQVKKIGESIRGLFVIEDWHNFGAYYDKTLLAWNHNFENHWGTLKNKYDERFHRMWNYYLLSCAGAFRARDIQLWQIVLSKGGIPGGYISIR